MSWRRKDGKRIYRTTCLLAWRTRLRGLDLAALGVHSFLTTGHCTSPIPGIVLGFEEELAAQVGASLEGFRKGFETLSKRGLALADWEHGVVWLPFEAADNVPSNPNVVTGWRQHLSEIPDCPLRTQAMQGIYQSIRDVMDGPEDFVSAFRAAFPEYVTGNPSGTLPEPFRNQEQEQEQEQDLKNTGAVAVAPVGLANPVGPFEAGQEARESSKAGNPQRIIPLLSRVTPTATPAPAVNRRGAESPRLRPLLDAMQALHEKRHGKYALLRKRDVPALTKLLELADDAEILRRWESGLQRPVGDFLRSTNVAELFAKWGKYALPELPTLPSAHPTCALPGCSTSAPATWPGDRELCYRHGSRWQQHCVDAGLGFTPSQPAWDDWSTRESRGHADGAVVAS